MVLAELELVNVYSRWEKRNRTTNLRHTNDVQLNVKSHVADSQMVSVIVLIYEGCALSNLLCLGV